MVKTFLTRFLRECLRCASGNVSIITAAAIVPLMIMGGSALDFGRVYLVKNRLQHACDASVLAYRRSMNGTNVVATTEPAARKFFDANFNANRYGSGVPAITFSVDAQVVVHGAATVTLPMTVMRAFNYPSQNVAVMCEAQLQLPNTDVMFVLDTTGSMTDTNSGDTTNKITALRSAVISFYNTLEAAKVSGTQVRYGFVPYSNTVNVGMLLKREWMVDSAAYQSREYAGQEYDVKVTTTTQAATLTSSTAWTPSTYTSSSYAGAPENCVAPASTVTTPTTNGTWSPSSTSLPRTRTNTRVVNGSSYSAATQSDGSCKISVTTYNNLTQTSTDTVTANPNAGQTSPSSSYNAPNIWIYKQKTFDVSGLKGTAASGLMAGGSLSVPIANPSTNATNLNNAVARAGTTVGNYTFSYAAPNGAVISAVTAANSTLTWNSTNACIEERATLRSGETGTAYDMDVDFVPTTDDKTRWRPFLPGLLFARQVTSTYDGSSASGWGWNVNNVTMPGAFTGSLRYTTNYPQLSSYAAARAACPSPARKLMSKESGLTLSVLTTYINGLSTGGDTYHDIGFLWGVRLASAQGLFASENTSAPNGFDISRNIIFMTDGATETHIQDYDAYALSALDRRRTAVSALPTDSAQNALVETRLLNYCAAAKSKGMTVWVIAFGTSLTTTLQTCATSGRSYQANNSAALNTAFADIASRIAQLRLTK
jgi:Flp pilus assembly protein TadG